MKRTPTFDARLVELARLGVIRLPRKAPPVRLPGPVKLKRPSDAVRLIAEDREAR
jgi:hypothetical protein